MARLATIENEDVEMHTSEETTGEITEIVDPNFPHLREEAEGLQPGDRVRALVIDTSPLVFSLWNS